jgi:hypothetical protein
MTFWELSGAATAQHEHTQAELLQLSHQMFDITTFNDQQRHDNCSIQLVNHAVHSKTACNTQSEKHCSRQ